MDGPGDDWNTPSNWLSAVPGPDGTAFFRGASPNVISMAGGVAVGTLEFTAPNYVFNVQTAVNINGSGVSAGLQTAPTFNV